MSKKWTNNLESQFLEYYQSEPILWDPTLKHHKNKLKNHDAWMRISVMMDMPVDILKQKKNSLCSSYRKYKSNYKKSLKSGAGADEVYKPSWFAYDVMDGFLGDTTACNNTINTETGNSEGGLEVEHDHIVTDEIDTEESQDSSRQSNAEITASQTIRRRKNPPELLDAGRLIKDTLDTFRTTLNKNVSETQPKQPDDCDLYSQLLATKLRSMPIQKRQKLMYDIDGLYLHSQYQSELSPMHPSLQSPCTEKSCTPPSTELQSTKCILKTIQNTQSGLVRPGTSFSTHSEPARNILTQNTTQNLHEGAPNAIIHSNESIHPPVLHILDNE